MKLRGGEYSTGTTGNFQSELTTSYPTLSHTVLPRTAKGRASWLASHVPHSRNHIGAKL
jgi:hypothetical protein